MAKIDLFDQKWIDLVFEGKNEAYGAYKLRQDTSNRNLWAMIALLVGIAAVVGIFLLSSFIVKTVQESGSDEVIATDVTLMGEEEEEEEEEEQEEVIDLTEPEPEKEEVLQEELVNTEKYTDLAMDDEKQEEPIKTAQEASEGQFTTGNETFTEGSEEGEKRKTEEMQVVEEKHEEVNTVFEVVEQMPQFPGGDAALMQYLSSHIKYPVIAEENGIQGRVVCTFVVERDGSITDVRVVKSVDPSLDKEAKRVIGSMPKWIPGKQNGAAVRVKYTVPVTFRLQ